MLKKQTVAMGKYAGLGVRLGVLLLADPDCTSNQGFTGTTVFSAVDQGSPGHLSWSHLRGGQGFFLDEMLLMPS